MKKTNDKNKILLVYGLMIFVFYIFFMRFLVKTDDGNFLGTVFDPDFSRIDFLKERYNALSGRTVGEFLVTVFYRLNPVIFKIISSLMVIYIGWFYCEISDYFSKDDDGKRRYIFCCSSMFLMLVSTLNPAVFWFAGAFTYLWPFTGILLCISAPVFYIIKDKISPVMYVISFIFSALAAAQEQSAAAVIACYIVLLVFACLKKKKLNAFIFLPLIPASVCSYFLFTSPGAHRRGVLEAGNGFERFESMNVFEKLFCGYSVFIAHSVFLSFFLICILAFLLIYTVVENKKFRIALYGFVVFVTTVINAVTAIKNHGIAHMIVRKAFIKGDITAGIWLLIGFGSALIIMILALTVKLIINNKDVGLPVALCLAAGFCCAMVMGFSSSIFASGQRVFFFTEMFIAAACVILYSPLEKNKFTSGIFASSLFYALGTYLVNCFAFTFFETPLMG